MGSLLAARRHLHRPQDQGRHHARAMGRPLLPRRALQPADRPGRVRRAADLRLTPRHPPEAQGRARPHLLLRPLAHPRQAAGGPHRLPLALRLARQRQVPALAGPRHFHPQQRRRGERGCRLRLRGRRVLPRLHRDRHRPSGPGPLPRMDGRRGGAADRAPAHRGGHDLHHPRDAAGPVPRQRQPVLL